LALTILALENKLNEIGEPHITTEEIKRKNKKKFKKSSNQIWSIRKVSVQEVENFDY
jgi:hypothetical protein